MTSTYSLEKHIENINLIENLISTTKVIKEEQVKLSFINLLADFVSDNQQYEHINAYSNLVETLVNTIEYCNSIHFTESELDEKLISVSTCIWSLLEEIKSLYKINVYFKGNDKYKLIDNIIKNKIYKNSNVIHNNKNIFNVLIISEETCNDEDTDLIKFDYIIHYDRFMNNCFNAVERNYQYDYDYNYLLHSIDKAKELDTKGIIVGSSYPLHGIDEKILNGNFVNLSLPSQDLYYSCKIAESIINQNKNISKCIIGTAYWSFYTSLSKSSKDGIPRIQKVYYPIFKDSHSYNYDGKVEKISLSNQVEKIISYIFDIDELDKKLSNLIYRSYKSYFNELRTRESGSLLGNRKLNSLSTNEKNSLSYERVASHNKVRKFIDTRDENVEILKRFLDFLNKNNIKPVILNFVTSEYYNKFFDKEFISEYLEVMKDLSEIYNFHFIDLNDYKIFKENDFVDFDHMNDSGALKVSELINEFLELKSNQI